MRTIFKVATVFLVVMMFVAGHYLAMDYINQVENMEFEDVLNNSSQSDERIYQEYPIYNKGRILSDEYIKYSKSLIANGTKDERCRDIFY
ncbi:MAG: hypothetical protein E7Z86_08150 [Methanosphaera stadtmanae]|jgi:hypothetical protein|nr:hypothetical protein [Methanosphaera stadtmanae]